MIMESRCTTMNSQRYPYVHCDSEGDSQAQNDCHNDDEASFYEDYESSQLTFGYFNSLNSSRVFDPDQLRSASNLVSYHESGEPHVQVFSQHHAEEAYPAYEYYDDGGTGDSPRYNIQGPIEFDDPQESYGEDVLYDIPQALYVQPNYPTVSNYGTVFLVLRHWIRIDISAEKAIYVTNNPGRCAAVLNDNGHKSAILHPNGKICQNGPNVHMETGNKMAKICKRGVIFTSTAHTLSYLVDPSGTKSTSDRFLDLSNDFTTHMFLSSSNPEGNNISKCHDMILESTYRHYNNGDEVWIVGGIRIKQNPWGEVRVTANYGKRVVRTSPTISTVSVATPFGQMAVSCHPYRHFSVKSGDKEVRAGSNCFEVQNGSQKAGFNINGRLVLY